MTTAVETLINQGLLIVGGDNFFIGKRLMALRTNHEVILHLIFEIVHLLW